MKKLGALIFPLFILGCKQEVSKNSLDCSSQEIFCTFELEDFEKSEFYRDYDIFSRKGIYKLKTSKLVSPFIQVTEINDSITRLRIFKSDYFNECLIPSENQVVYSRNNIPNHPRHVYSKVENNEIIRYGYYDYSPYETDDIILPSTIEIITSDTLYSYFLPHTNCFDTLGINGKIFPFQGTINRNCESCYVEYYSENPTNANTYYYFRDRSLNQKYSKEHPGVYVKENQREFLIWKDFHRLSKIMN